MSVQLNFITALPSEARPIIDRFKLGPPNKTNGITWYENDEIRLAVSGVGKSASAFAVGVLSGMANESAQSLWLNVGIAGHRDAAPGTIGIAHRIDDLATARVHYPAIVFNAPCASFPVACFDRPTTSYHGDALCDMESAAFFTAAIRTSGVEFAHILKIVSDNTADHLTALNRQTITDLIRGQIDVIATVAEALMHIASRVAVAPRRESSVATLKSRWRFSVTQSLQLHELERRWLLLRPDSAWPPIDLSTCASASDVIERLRNAVDGQALQIDA
jgi:nucleoside phosphorylase